MILRARILLAGLLLLLLPVAAGAQGGPRTSSQISNKKAPLKGERVVRLKEQWRVGTSAESDEVVFGLITDIAVGGDGTAYVLDYQLAQIVVIAPSGKQVGIIGREGDGPGELRRPNTITLMPPDRLGVALAYPTRIALFDRSGSSVGTVTVPAGKDDPPIIVNLELAGDHLVAHAISQAFVDDKERQTHYLCSIDENGKELVRYYEAEYSSDLAHPAWEERSQSLRGRWATREDGSVLVAASFSDYEIRVFNRGGDLSQVITCDYDHRKRSTAEKKFVRDWASWNPAAILPGTAFDIEVHDKDIMTVHVGPSQKCWVLTSRGLYDRASGAAGTYDVYGVDGRLEERITLMAAADPIRDNFYFAGSRMLVAGGFRDALVTAAGRGATAPESATAEPEPMSVISYVLE